MKGKVPYSIMAATAILGGHPEGAEAVYQRAIEEIGGDCCKLIESYSHLDLPIVIATMEIIAGTMKSTLDSGGLGIVNALKKKTTCIAVDANEFLRQMGDNDGDNAK